MLTTRYTAPVWVCEYHKGDVWVRAISGSAARMIDLAGEMRALGHRTRVRFIGVGV